MNTDPLGTLPEVSIILPCLNEAEGLRFCINQIRDMLRESPLSAEVIIVNNNSTDASVDIITSAMKEFSWLRLEHEPIPGYGSAYLKGLSAARGSYFFLADADGTYNFGDVPRFVSELKAGADMVVGNRFITGLDKKVMPWLHQYIGNPIISGQVRLFFKVPIHDVLCGARALSKTTYEKLDLHTRGMEFATEMIIKASKAKLTIKEIPIKYSPRLGTSKLKSFSDGWRYIRYHLLYAPLILFMLPGLTLFALGAISMLILYFGHLSLFNIEFYTHPMFLSAVLMILGYQLVFFGGFAKMYSIAHLGDTNKTIQSLLKHLTIEKAGLVGITLTLIGGFIYIYIFTSWIQSGFGSLDQIKNSVVALTCITLGVQTFFSAFMLSIIGIKEK